jgi:hypothetical protein
LLRLSSSYGRAIKPQRRNQMHETLKAAFATNSLSKLNHALQIAQVDSMLVDQKMNPYSLTTYEGTGTVIINSGGIYPRFDVTFERMKSGAFTLEMAQHIIETTAA